MDMAVFTCERRWAFLRDVKTSEGLDRVSVAEAKDCRNWWRLLQLVAARNGLSDYMSQGKCSSRIEDLECIIADSGGSIED